jgi:pyruvate formate lyase activating enzyme
MSSPDVMIIPNNGEPCSEIRPLYFLGYLGLKVVDSRILSFGACNFRCTYCKRGGAFQNGEYISGAIPTRFDKIIEICDDAKSKEQVVRLSGGDPVMFINCSMQIAKRYGKISITHNGSSPEFIRMIIPYLHSAAIDIKGTPDTLGIRAGIGGLGRTMFNRAVECQHMLVDAGIPTDVRTIIFKTDTIDDLAIICKCIDPRSFWTWRLYNVVHGCDWDRPTVEQVNDMAATIANNFGRDIGIRQRWSGGLSIVRGRYGL